MGRMGQSDLAEEQNELFEYGIMIEKSDIRAHVSVVNRTIYVYKTIEGIKAIEEYHPKLVTAGQQGVDGITATGWLVKPDQINNMQRLRYYSWPKWSMFDPNMTTTQKGKLAVDCVINAIKLRPFPFFVDTAQTDSQHLEISGTDILLWCKRKIQVKCDYYCGEKPNGTGNLFLQKAERNPLKRH